MADIDANQHGPLLFDCLRELHAEKVTANLRIDLSENVGGLRKIEGTAVATSDDLRRHLVLLEDFFESSIVALVAKYRDADQRMSEDTLLVDHVVSQLFSKLVLVVLVVEFDPVRLLNDNLKLLGRFDKVSVDVVRNLIVGAILVVLVDHDPLLRLQVNGFLNRKLSQNILVTVNYLVVLEDLRSVHNSRLNLDRNCFDLEVPLLESFLGLQDSRHVLDALDLVLRRDVSPLKSFTHAWALAH